VSTGKLFGGTPLVVRPRKAPKWADAAAMETPGTVLRTLPLLIALHALTQGGRIGD
jgi:hypothetical protein